MAEGAPPPYSEAVGDKLGSNAPGGYPPPPGYGAVYTPMGPNQAGYPPPKEDYTQPGYQTGTVNQTGAAHSTVVMTQPSLTVVQMFRETPVRTTCPYCHADIVTATSYVSGTFSWLLCVILCLLGLFWGCCLIPFCVTGCQDVIHTCPNCHKQISRWGRM